MTMDSFTPLPSTLDEARIAAEQPLVRAQLVNRFERLYAWCQEQVEFGERPDPRFAELQVRVLDRLMKLYRLDSVVVVPPDESDEQAAAVARKQARLVIAAQVASLTERLG